MDREGKNGEERKGIFIPWSSARWNFLVPQKRELLKRGEEVKGEGGEVAACLPVW